MRSVCLSTALACLAAFVALDASACIPDDKTLCLDNNRFQIQVNWETDQGESGTANAVPLRNASNQVLSDSGYFWFFNQDNVEMVMKVLDGCGVNNRYWVFAAGLTNVEVEITVTDTLRGFVSKTYVNPQQTAFQPIQDTAAFDTCP